MFLMHLTVMEALGWKMRTQSRQQRAWEGPQRAQVFAQEVPAT